MGNHLNDEKKLLMLEIFRKTKNINEVARKSGTSRNTVRRYMKKFGLIKEPLSKAIAIKARRDCEPMIEPINAPEPAPYNSDAQTVIEKMDFYFLAELIKETNFDSAIVSRNMKNIGQIAQKIGRELGINSTADLLKLELAMNQLIVSKRFVKASFATTDKNYIGPLSKTYEKQVKATQGNMQIAHKSIETFVKLINDLEGKYGCRFPFQKASFTLNQQNLNFEGPKNGGPVIEKAIC